ncbi:MAG: hypothetical protein QME85_01565 [Candidatus Saccharicenans sp.]|nr:hypothetical protein [Candidatus Saccharicenans sp.]
MGKIIALVACVSKKKVSADKAENLYISDWFRKASEYAKRKAEEWYILSAEHGVLNPEDEIAPYEKTLKKMKKDEKIKWAERVKSQLEKIASPGDTLIILAGNEYRKLLLDFFFEKGCKVEIPMKGLRIGEQIKWLQQQLENPEN